ncbi:hypothetical protein [Sphaerospermopsis sp. FACHB-1194]|nr:hypothetical protein [Sphaerospermopsis sp. FACHB-1194]
MVLVLFILYYTHSQTEITKALTGVEIEVLWNQIAYPSGDW